MRTLVETEEQRHLMERYTFHRESYYTAYGIARLAADPAKREEYADIAWRHEWACKILTRAMG